MTWETDVVIIGAGTAGLSAAKELERQGVAFVLIEAASRIGGRAHSEEIAPDAWFDHGCAWLVNGEDNPFAKIADDRGIALARHAAPAYKAQNHRFVHGGAALTGAALAACHGYYAGCYAAISRAARRARDVAVGDVIDLDSDFAAPFAESIATAWGVDVDAVSAADVDSARGTLGFPVMRGYGNLIAYWGRNVAVSLNTCARRIDWSGPGVAVETTNGVIRGQAALITVSTGVLDSGDIVFSPPLPIWKQEAIRGLPMGVENKIGVAFDRDVFGADGRGHYTVWNDSGESAKIDAGAIGINVAVVFVGGRQAEALEVEEVQRAGASHDFAVARLVEVFGSDLRAHVTRSIATAWRSAPLVRGSWACAVPGHAHQRNALARPVDHRLFFAGEATQIGGQGTCDGAYRSGQEAAHMVAGQVERLH